MQVLIRIVRMTFQEDKVEQFLQNFHGNKAKIRAFSGCQYLSLLRDAAQPNIYYTLSHWDSEKHLNDYRNSELFREVWAKTKILFADKPSAYSVFKHEEL